jgi:hypothetical protein
MLVAIRASHATGDETNAPAGPADRGSAHRLPLRNPGRPDHSKGPSRGRGSARGNGRGRTWRQLITALALFACPALATAQPSISGTSGTWSQDQTVTITGSNFGTKTTAAPVVFDDSDHGQAVSARWSGGWPSLGTAACRIQYSTTIRSVALPYTSNGNTSYLRGGHCDTVFADEGWNVLVWKNRTVSSFPAYTYAHWYQRVDPAWVNQDPSDGNFKWYDWSSGSEPYQTSNGANWYLECANWDVGENCQNHFNDDGASLTQDFNWYGTSTQDLVAAGWHKYEIFLKFTQSGAGLIEWHRNGVLIHSWAGSRTDGMTGTARNESFGGYTFDDGNSNNYRYFDDIYYDTTWAHVELCAGSTWATRGVCEPQIPTNWNANGQSITITVNLGQFASGTKYLYVMDSAQAKNALGTAITVDGAGSPAAAPTRLRFRSVRIDFFMPAFGLALAFPVWRFHASRRPRR